MAAHSCSVEWRFVVPPHNGQRVVVHQRQDGPFRADAVGSEGHYYTSIESHDAEVAGQWNHVRGSSTGGHATLKAALAAAEEQWREAVAKTTGAAR